MKRRWVAVGLGLLLAVSASAQQGELPPGVDKAKTILDRTIEALGGQNFLAARDIKRKGRYYSFNRGQLSGPGTKFIDYVKFPGKEWLELGDDGKIVYLNNQDQGWELDRQGIREMTPGAIENFLETNRKDIDYLLRFAYPQGELQLYYLGREFVDNRRAHVIEMVYEDNQSVTIVIDAGKYLPMQIRFRQRDELSGEWIHKVDFFGKYINVQGVQTPMHLAREQNGMRSSEIHLKEVEYNTGVDDQFFTLASLEEHWEDVK